MVYSYFGNREVKTDVDDNYNEKQKEGDNKHCWLTQHAQHVEVIVDLEIDKRPHFYFLSIR